MSDRDDPTKHPVPPVAQTPPCHPTWPPSPPIYGAPPTPKADPYRSDPVDELRRVTLGSLQRVVERSHALSPSMLERLATALAWFDSNDERAEPPAAKLDHPLRIIEALQLAAPTAAPPGGSILCSSLIEIGEQFGAGHFWPIPLENLHVPFYVMALRVEIVGNRMMGAPYPEFSIAVNDRVMLERCPVSEFSRMTTIDLGCISQAVPPMIQIWTERWRPADVALRLIFRGHRPAPYPSFYPGHGSYPGYADISVPMPGYGPYPSRRSSR